jgi:hypothetical protein
MEKYLKGAIVQVDQAAFAAGREADGTFVTAEVIDDEGGNQVYVQRVVPGVERLVDKKLVPVGSPLWVPRSWVRAR